MKSVERNPMEINNRLAPLQSNAVSITSSQEYGCLRKKKIDELTEVQNDVQYIKEDISLVERHRINLYRARDRYLVKMPVHGGELTGSKTWSSSSINKDTILFPSGKPQGSTQMKEASSGLSSQHTNQSSLAVTRKKRVQSQFNDLQHCYLQNRRQVPNPLQNHDKRDDDVIQREGIVQVYQIFNLYFPLLHNIGNLSIYISIIISIFVRLRVIAELRHGELFHSANIVSRLNEPPEVHCPVVEMPTISKLSCLSWNKHTKNHIASSDYEGISEMEYEEHEKRVWSVDYSRTESSMLVSGSDDCKILKTATYFLFFIFYL
ncbi:hypothetical protein LXL04_014254 [Taraxacum kok-saghyz]